MQDKQSTEANQCPRQAPDIQTPRTRRVQALVILLSPVMADDQDTELLLAMLSSMLATPIDDQNTLLDALVQAEGDVERAAALLNSRVTPADARTQSKTMGVKRKRGSGLEGWLTGSDAKGGIKAQRRDITPTRGSSSGTLAQGSPPLMNSPVKLESAESSGSPRKVKPVTPQELMTILRPPNSSDSKPQGPPKFPPLTLTTPAMVAKHTPCTMHLSVLPPELASR